MFLNAASCSLPMVYWPPDFNQIDTSFPMVSCIMPTANRQHFIPKAIKYFLEQDYPYKELIIIDDGEESIARMLPNLYCIRYFYLEKKLLISTKRNIACEKAAGSIIIHWDDDDWYANNWISYQVNSILQYEVDLCGLSQVQFFSVKHNKFYISKYQTIKKNWLIGATLAYRKSYWDKHHFPEIEIGEDNLFVRNKNAKIFAHDYFEGFLAIVHSSNARLKDV
ncbi:glycosyltransferase family A protein [Pedobacter sp. MC2016-15]|uniref:glycosyltransferase family 2 protein n=1 Tax=Pedobacter sp. MC2016-15 TaxID=2994473 RepID=UPI002245972E|nr:glycosyltransferase family A protein [Pedobacter sp. MC2016-15]MCX2477791.1 glycosyltransferase family A protein [Pedobacter sp. MC2016-15]